MARVVETAPASSPERSGMPRAFWRVPDIEALVVPVIDLGLPGRDPVHRASTRIILVNHASKITINQRVIGPGNSSGSIAGQRLTGPAGAGGPGSRRLAQRPTSQTAQTDQGSAPLIEVLAIIDSHWSEVEPGHLGHWCDPAEQRPSSSTRYDPDAPLIRLDQGGNQ